MENKIEMSLDDIIKLNRNQKKKPQGGNRIAGKGRGGGGGGKGVQSQKNRTLHTSPRKPGGGVSKRPSSGVIQKQGQKRQLQDRNRAGANGRNGKGFQRQESHTVKRSPGKKGPVLKSLVFEGHAAAGKRFQHQGGRKFHTSERKSGGGVLKRSGSGGIQKAKFSKSVVSSFWKQGVNCESGRGISKMSDCCKLSLSNLDYGISDSDIREIFAACGQLKKATVHYDRSGRSLGTADLIFTRKSDALKAIQQYHGVSLDGRPMKIQFLNNASSLTRPVTAADASLQKQKPKERGNRRGAAAGGKNRADVASRNGNAGSNRTKPAPTAEQLDAELDAYHKDMNLKIILFNENYSEA